MNEKALGLLGLMKRAGKIAPGEVNSEDAARKGKTRLILLASDASANAEHKAGNLSATHNIPLYKTNFTKYDLAYSLGTGLCSIVSICDGGFAEGFIKKLEDIDEAQRTEILGRIRKP